MGGKRFFGLPIQDLLRQPKRAGGLVGGLLSSWPIRVTPFSRGYWRVSVVANGHSGLAHGQSQKSKPRDHQVRWSITLLKATPAKYLGQVFASTESEAIKEAVKEFEV